VSLRQKLLMMFSITVAVAVAAVGWTVSLRVRRVFDQLDQEQTQVFARQFRREFQHRADDVSAALDRMAASERLTHMAFDLSHQGEAALYLNEAETLAQEYELSYLEITDADGKIISSAQWPARFGYPDPSFAAAGRPPFLKEEAMPDGSSQTGLFAVRSVRSLESGEEVSLYLIGGTKLDRDFLTDLPVRAGSHVYLYRNSSVDFDPRSLSGTGDEAVDASKYRPLIDGARKSGADASGIVYISPRREDSVNAAAIPLKGEDGGVLAVLLLANSRRGMVEVQRHIRAIAFGVAGIGILFAIGASLWIAARVSRPIEQLALAAGEVAQGRWDTHVTIHAKDEVGALAESFNRMTSQLVEQRDQLIQSERVAAWRELARRLAHELKNPLFPLQLTVENMVRARQLPSAEFDEVFAEGTATLQSEIANLKQIIARFSDFSNMPKPQEEKLDVRDLVRRVLLLYDPALREHRTPIVSHSEISETPLLISGDPELLHRAISNLVLNAIDAMPCGGELRASAALKDGYVQLRISDTGGGLTPEECDRLFTPYYTTKQYGTGLGLAIVQSVVADHRGTVYVESEPGAGATFIIELPAVEEIA
jgi:two-component system, NtrC family, nitrogen regulation sensor histidine kinase NtrY